MNQILTDADLARFSLYDIEGDIPFLPTVSPICGASPFAFVLSSLCFDLNEKMTNISIRLDYLKYLREIMSKLICDEVSPILPFH